MGRRAKDAVQCVRWAAVLCLHLDQGLIWDEAYEKASATLKSTLARGSAGAMQTSYIRQNKKIGDRKDRVGLARKWLADRDALLSRPHEPPRQQRYGSEKRHRRRKVRTDGKPTPPPYCRWVGNVLYCDLRVAGKHIVRSLFTKDVAIAAQNVAVVREQLIADAYYGGIGKPAPQGVDISGTAEPPKSCYWLRGSVWTSKTIRGRCYQRSLRTMDARIAAARRDYVHGQLIEQHGPAPRPGPHRTVRAAA